MVQDNCKVHSTEQQFKSIINRVCERFVSRYQYISAKNCSKEERGQSETLVRLKGLEQKFPPNKEWLP